MNTTAAVAAAMRMSHITGPPLAKSVGMALLKAFVSEVQSAKLDLSNVPPDPFGVAPAVDHRMDKHCFLPDGIIYSKREFF